MKKLKKPSSQLKRASKARATSAATQSKKIRSSASVVSLSLTQLSTIYVLFIIINSLVVYLAHSIFPQSVVLGTHLLSPMIALLQSMLVFTLIIVGSMPIIEVVTKLAQFRVSEKNWVIIYYLVNVVGLWTTARFAELLGLGISSWIVAALLGLVLSLLQSLTNKLFKAVE